MQIPGYSSLNAKEKEVLHAFLEQQGMKVDAEAVVDAEATALGINWCKILCGIKTAVQVAACAGNPACIAKAVAEGLACVAACK